MSDGSHFLSIIQILISFYCPLLYGKSFSIVILSTVSLKKKLVFAQTNCQIYTFSCGEPLNRRHFKFRSTGSEKLKVSLKLRQPHYREKCIHVLGG